MTFNDIKVVAMPGSTREFKTDERSAANGSIARTIKAGEPVKECTNYVIRISDDDVGARTDILVGIAANESDETTSADGVVNVTMLIGGASVLRGTAKTTTSADTSSKLLTLLNDDFPFGASYTIYDSANEGVITIDESTDDGTNHGLKCIGGSGDSKAELDVVVKPLWLFTGQVA